MGVLAFGDSSTWATRADVAPAAAGTTNKVAAAAPVADRKVGQVVSLKAVKAPSSSSSGGGGGAGAAGPRSSNPNFAPRSAWPGARGAAGGAGEERDILHA